MTQVDIQRIFAEQRQQEATELREKSLLSKSRLRLRATIEHIELGSEEEL